MSVRHTNQRGETHSVSELLVLGKLNFSKVTQTEQHWGDTGTKRAESNARAFFPPFKSSKGWPHGKPWQCI